MKKIFIDGSAGTTGLRIHERLSKREDIEVITLPEEERKKEASRRKALNGCDIAFLCLPDDAAREAVGFIENPDVVVIDTSTAHRTEPGWSYGFPELGDDFADAIKGSKRITVPGCHAGGFIALVYPLVRAGIILQSARLFCHSVTGYSGGGKKMIAEYEAANRPYTYASPRQYALTQNHKHLKEMQKIAGLSHSPVFCPVVADFYSGMVVTVPLFREDLANAAPEDIRGLYSEIYKGPVVLYDEKTDENGFIGGNLYSGFDSMHITVAGNEERILLIAAYDNLGKGASGEAIECMNIVLDKPISKGLNLK